MDRPTSRTPGLLAASLAGLAATAVLGSLVPLGAAAAAEPSASPSATPSSSPTSGTGKAPRLPALPAPSIVGPDETATVLKDVVLDWEPVKGATSYDVQVGTDENWSDEPTFSVTTLSTQLTLPGYLPHASYVWRVAAARENGSGRWSVNGSFSRGWRDRPSPLTPAPDSLSRVMPEFTWTPVRGASAYEVQVSDTATFDERQGPGVAPTTDSDPTQGQVLPKVDTCFTTHTSVTFFTGQASHLEDNPGPCTSTLLGTGEDRYWRVRALDRFATDEVPDTDTTPASDEGISHLPPDDDGKKDDDVVSACPGAPTTPASPSASPTVATSPSAAPKPQPVGCERTHPVEQGAWSAASRFRVAAPPRPADTTDRFRSLPLVQVRDLREGNPCSAVGAHVVCSDFPTLRWDPVAGATSYRVYVSLTPTYSNIQRIADTYGLSFTPTDSWRDNTAGQAYYYVVQPCTTAGCGAVTTSPPSFRKSSPPLALGTPQDGSLIGATDVVFRWQDLHSALAARNASRDVQHRAPTSGASAYRLQVTTEDDPDFRGELVEDVVVDGTTHATTDVAYGDGEFLWRVQPVDGSGHRLPWSAARAFTRDGTPPTVVVSGGTAVDSPLVARFSEPVRGVSGSSVVVSPLTQVALALSTDGRTASVRPARTWTPGQAYTLRLGSGITDVAGNALVPVSRTAKVSGLVDDGSKALAYAGAWGARRASNAVGGGFRVSSPVMRRQTAASVTVAGRGVLVTGCVGPAGGMMDVWVDGTKRARVDTYRSFSGCGVRLARVVLADGVHRVQVRGIGMKRSASKGTTVMLDAVNAL